eukprot:CAMPEP_0176108566 /NCGR_PEP_ID=MMETSP0120_2-20121206/54501_1 /TAXON_ID=160619 /ORGANISM="Kryptoperidinium foliaceum, Strain CCMP 1326" /LENGTH=214 /DNA_ID=CAMNT_0017442735 /DNA_START=29 /DNA_END=673 /DNA_ORIENTATION=+
MITRRMPCEIRRSAMRGCHLVLLRLVILGSAVRINSRGLVDLGRNMSLDASGAVLYPSGTKWDPFEDATREKALSSDDFVCQDGVPFGLKLPMGRHSSKEFIYLKRAHMPQFWPLQFHLDMANVHSQYIFVPPLDSSSNEWSLLHIRAGETFESLAHQHVFSLGDYHPCGPTADWEVQIAESHGRAGSRVDRRATRALWTMATQYDAISPPEAP